MNVTIEQLLQVIGEQTVELRLLRQEMARLTASADDKKPHLVPPPVAVGKE